MLPITLYAYPETPKGPTAQVQQFDESLTEKLKSMVSAIEDFELHCIAAPHINLSESIIVLNKGDIFEETKHIINPEITWVDGLQEVETECLFFPGTMTTIVRPKELKITYKNEANQEATLHVQDEKAAIIHYLLDCLQGKLILDYMSKLKRERFLVKYKKHLKRNYSCGTDCTHEHH